MKVHIKVNKSRISSQKSASAAKDNDNMHARFKPVANLSSIASGTITKGVVENITETQRQIIQDFH